jgi:hypothetical protein
MPWPAFHFHQHVSPYDESAWHYLAYLMLEIQCVARYLAIHRDSPLAAGKLVLYGAVDGDAMEEFSNAAW